jgi:hypothetical protein
MLELIGVALIIIGVWQGFKNFMYEDAAQKEYGIFRPPGTPNFMARFWICVFAVVLGVAMSGIFDNRGGSNDGCNSSRASTC